MEKRNQVPLIIAASHAAAQHAELNQSRDVLLLPNTCQINPKTNTGHFRVV